MGRGSPPASRTRAPGRGHGRPVTCGPERSCRDACAPRSKSLALSGSPMPSVDRFPQPDSPPAPLLYRWRLEINLLSEGRPVCLSWPLMVTPSAARPCAARWGWALPSDRAARGCCGCRSRPLGDWRNGRGLVGRWGMVSGAAARRVLRIRGIRHHGAAGLWSSGRGLHTSGEEGPPRGQAAPASCRRRSSPSPAPHHSVAARRTSAQTGPSTVRDWEQRQPTACPRASVGRSGTTPAERPRGRLHEAAVECSGQGPESCPGVTRRGHGAQDRPSDVTTGPWLSCGVAYTPEEFDQRWLRFELWGGFGLAAASRAGRNGSARHQAETPTPARTASRRRAAAGQRAFDPTAPTVAGPFGSRHTQRRPNPSSEHLVDCDCRP